VGPRTRNCRLHWIMALVLNTMLVGSNAQAPQPIAAVVKFEDVAASAGLTVPHISTPNKESIIESMSGGVGFIDCDNDGKLDIVTVNGSSVDRYKSGGDLMVTLYHQGADLKFSDITLTAGLTRKGWGMGVAAADFDNDGLQDLYVTGFGGNVLYRNLGGCKFEDVTEKAGLRAGGFSAGAAWGDYDKDGFVDLFVARYVDLDINHLPAFGSKAESCTIFEIKVQCGPLGLQAETNLLYHNRGDGTFEEVSKKAGIANPQRSYGMQPLWLDYDNDGWPDLYVANDIGTNFLYRNKHDGTFEDVSLISGTAVDAAGKAQGSMGVDAADFNHDGKLDLFVTTYAFQPDALYENQGDSGFADISASAHLAQPTYTYVGWGTAFFDAANESWPDLMIANGHVYPQIDSIAGAGQYREPIQFFRNNRNGTFRDATSESGLDKLPLLSRRGAAFGDVSNNGKIDALILNVDGTPSLLMNRTQNAGHSVSFHLIGTKSNRAAIGARVTVTVGDVVQFNEVRGGSSYLSQNDLRQHFGLAAHTVIDSVRVAWPSGRTETYERLPADFIYTIVEGAGISGKIPFSDDHLTQPSIRPTVAH
jgi:enediyne biosynthesis protein E4